MRHSAPPPSSSKAVSPLRRTDVCPASSSRKERTYPFPGRWSRTFRPTSRFHLPGQPPESPHRRRGGRLGVRPGRYRDGAHKDGFAPHLDESALPVVELNSGLDATNITSFSSTAIAGTVLDSTCRPLFGASVVALLKRLEMLSPSSVPPLPNGLPMHLPFGHAETNTRG
jgi:hypothetical protein